jgi:NitT/TauT family transport system substrate-binding protein
MEVTMITINSKNSHNLLTRRSILRNGAGMAMTGVFLSMPSIGQASGTQDINIKLDWLMSNGQIGDVVASKKGFFEDQGLNVTFLPGGPNSQTVPPVLSGMAQLGQFSSSGQALLARGNGIPLKMFAAGYRISPFAFFSLPNAPIREPKDVVGKRIGIQPTARFVLDLLLLENNIDPASLEIISIGYDMSPLLSGQVDAVTGWVTNTRALSVIGPDRIDMTERETGLQSYSDCYFAHENMLKDHGDVAASYIAGAAKGWEWTYKNREEAVDIMVDAYPNLDRETEKATIDKVIDLSFDSVTKEHGWGWVETDKLQRQINQYSSVGKFEKEIPTISTFLDMSALEATSDIRPKLG